MTSTRSGRWGDVGDEMGFVEWLEHGRRLGGLATSIAWSIGDWVNFGTRKFGEKYREAEQVTGYDVKSLMNMSYVASRVAADRRRPELPWSHHAEVAGLVPEDQERWLAFAIEKRLSVRRMREALRLERVRQRRAEIGAQDGAQLVTVPAAQDTGSAEAGGAEASSAAPSAATATAQGVEAPVVDPSAWHCPNCGHPVPGES